MTDFLCPKIAKKWRKINDHAFTVKFVISFCTAKFFIMLFVFVGSMLGPVAAGLADLAGYYLPFVVVGSLPLFTASLATVTMSTQTSKSSSGGVSILALLTSPGVFLMAAAMALCIPLPTMTQPILTTHLQPFNLSLPSIGGVFLIYPLCYSIVSPIVGKIAGLFKGHELKLIVFGVYGMTVSILSY